MFERFTDRARRVVVLAQEESQRLGHNYVGTEHLLLGLVREGEGVAAKVLDGLGVGLDRARAAVAERAGKGPGPPEGHVPFTPRAKKVLELSLREALQLGHNYVGTEHILLGIVREGDGVASAVLVDLGVDPRAVRERTTGLLGGLRPAAASGAEAASPVSEPTCPWCQSLLEGRLGTRALGATKDDEGGVQPVIVVYCRACGRPLGFTATPG